MFPAAQPEPSVQSFADDVAILRRHMGHYDLNRMGWQQFEHMVQALARKELGNGVRSFGSGRDGQRDATFDGPVSFPVGNGPTWNGYGVIQVKHRERPTTTTGDWQWFIEEVREELRGWKSKRLHSKRTPKYLLFVTNVTLTGTEGSGGKDTFERAMRSAETELGLQGWFVWDYTEIRTLLDTHTSVRQRYLELIVTGDFLARLEALLPAKTAMVAEGAAQHAVSDLVARQWVRTGDAGYQDGSKVRLADIAIDLPCVESGSPQHPTDPRRGAASVTLATGDQVLTSSNGPGPQGVVLVGGPGQGKSTIGQVIAHAYRVAFLRDTDINRYGATARHALDGLRERLVKAGIAAPERRRWPIVVELAKAAAAVARDDNTFSLLKYIADMVLVEGKATDPSALLGWMSSWPCCLVLDGLDEVPDATVRSRLMSAISGFVSELSAQRADMLIVATTRPQGYRGEFRESFPCRQLELLEFTESEALHYSEALTAGRTVDDPDLATQVTDRLINAVHSRVTQRLMTTPLQVTIMTALAEEAVELPSDRFELFDRYYKVVYEREVAKADAFAELRTLRTHIDYLHERAALKLQARMEEPGKSDAVLTKREIELILRRRLAKAGFDEAEWVTVAEKLRRLSMERIVMLVSRRKSKYEFEVRSLQEYMAARALTDGDDITVLENLRELLPSTHWRNTWLLAAGRLLNRREHLSDELVELVTKYDTESVETEVTKLGAALAGELYVDNFGSEFPTIRQALLDSGMAQFGETVTAQPRALTSLIELAVAHPGPERKIALNALHELSRENLSNLATKYLSERTEGMSSVAKQARTTLIEGRRYLKPTDHSPRGRTDALARSVERVAPAVPEALVLAERLNEEAASATPSVGLLQALDSPRAREALASAIASISKNQPDAASYGTDILRQYASRSRHRQKYAS